MTAANEERAEATCPRPSGGAMVLGHGIWLRCRACRHTAVVLPAALLWRVYCIPGDQRIAKVVLKNTEDLDRAFFLDTDDLEILIVA